MRRDKQAERDAVYARRRRCRHAGILMRGRTVRGTWQFFYWCDDCGNYKLDPPYLTKDLIDNPDELPVAWDNDTPDIPWWSYGRGECAHCKQETLVERHHWAPRHLFEDADDWPTANLCQPCHSLWHRIVTPAMSQVGKAQKQRGGQCPQ